MSTVSVPPPSASAPSANVGAPPSFLGRVPPQQLVLIVLLLAEIAIFSIFGAHFFSINNLLQVIRQNVELGLLALALTPVILTGGIDLSVGSLLGLCAVLFGKLWRDAHFSPLSASLITLFIGGVAGSLNGLLITRFRIPALIVTLGSYSLFRGLAEGITKGADNFTDFPDAFLAWGQGRQLWIFAIAAVGFWILVHRSTVGRAVSAIGFSPEGARYAGLPVNRYVALTYILTGLASGGAAVIYAARVGQSTADAGLNYELYAITAVVLGGTSIFGGKGTVIGTLMGLFAVALLQNGLRLADQRPQSAGVLTGVLLLVAIGVGSKQFGKAHRTAATNAGRSEELDMRNSQLAALCVVILIAALIVTGGNFALVKSLGHNAGSQAMTTEGGSTQTQGSSNGQTAAPKALTIGMMPKSIGNAYFISCHKGAADAAKELGVNLLWDGPTDADPGRQNEIVETWITRGVDAIAVSVENRKGLSTALVDARKHGIKVVTFDADADTDARDFFVNQATPQGIGQTLMDDAAATMNNSGSFAIITSTLTAANQNEWIKYIRQENKDKFPNISEIADLQPCNDQQDQAFAKATELLNAHKDLKLIMAVCSPGVPGAAEAVKQSGRTDVKVVGLGLPNENKQYVHAGITTAVVLWNTMDLGYLTVYAAEAVKTGTLNAGGTSLTAGRLGKLEVKGDNVLLGTPFTFNKDNIEQFDF